MAESREELIKRLKWNAAGRPMDPTQDNPEQRRRYANRAGELEKKFANSEKRRL